MEKKKYIICGKFFDGVEQILKKDIKILVEGAYITAIGTGVALPGGRGSDRPLPIHCDPGLDRFPCAF